MDVSLITIGQILGGIAALTALYKVFDLLYKIRKKYEDIEKRLVSLELQSGSGDGIKSAMLLLFSDLLYQKCTYYISKEKISFEEFRAVTQLYNNYVQLGGNGYGTALYNQVCALKKTRDNIITVNAGDIDYTKVKVGDGFVIPKDD